MDGVLNVLKPPGMTSMDVISFLRKVVEEKKGGHLGTLDPDVSGVLPIFFGKATRAISLLEEGDKVYRGEMTLGKTTDTQDSTGEIISDNGCDIDEHTILECINSFVGEISQIPPMYSAIKVNGEKLIDLARQGETVERKPRQVTIHNINVISVTPYEENGKRYVKALMDIECSRGTYIRTLFHDIGGKLGVGGMMTFLERIQSGRFKIDSAYTLDEILKNRDEGTLENIVMDVSKCFNDLPRVNLTEDNERRIINGIKIRFRGKRSVGRNAIFAYDGHFIGVGEMEQSGELYLLKLKKQFVI